VSLSDLDWLSGFGAFDRRVTSALLKNEMTPAPLATVGGLTRTPWRS